MSEKKAFCEWKQFDGEGNYFNSDCGMAFYFEDGTATDNGFKFCPKCGKPMKEILWAIDDEDIAPHLVCNSDSMTDEEYEAFEKIFEGSDEQEQEA